MSDTTVQTNSKVTPSIKAFSSVSQLMKDSWERVKRTWKQLLLLYVIIVVLMVVLFGGAAAAGFGYYMANQSSPDVVASMIAMGVIALIGITFLAVIIGSIFNSAMLLAVAESSEYPTVGSKISRGLQLFFPMFLTSLIVVFLVYGGLGLLIIPGIAIAILTSFTMYEIVFTQSRTTTAIRNSVTIIQQNFGELFARIGIIFLISIGINIISSILRSSMGDSEAAAGLSGLISLVISPIFALFTLAYYYQVYTEARNLTDFSKPASILWMWICSILGWVVGILIVVSLARFVGPMMEDAMKKEFGKDFDTSSSPSMLDDSPVTDFNADSFIEQYGQDMTAEEKQALKDSLSKTEKMMQEDQSTLQNEQ